MMRDSCVLVTGGCGYIGSHVVLKLREQGAHVVVVDNLSTGFRDAVADDVTFYEGDVGDHALIRKVLKNHKVDGIVHFAASIVVPESVANPLLYYHNNTVSTVLLLEEVVKAGVKNVIFSSTAAVYGENANSPVSESSLTNPSNPYGMSKLMDEYIIRDVSKAHGLNHIILRYFNVAGADLEGRLGQRSPNATHLIKVACEAAVGKRDGVTVFGTDYPTPDGTAIRDYIHVDDLALAHVLAFERCLKSHIQETFNCGYGAGFSVRDVLAMVNKIANKPINIVEGARREGDVSMLVANSERIRERLAWQPRFASLEAIVSSAYRWESRLSSTVS